RLRERQTHAVRRARFPVSFAIACPMGTTTEIHMSHAIGLLILCTASVSSVRAGEPIVLFGGKDTAKGYMFLRDPGKGKDPNGNFTVRDGILRIAGQDFGALITRDEYANYEVRMEYAWGGKVWPPREKTARDSGLLLHCTGPDGAVSKSWLEGIQCNMLEGATGDSSITGTNPKYGFRAQAEERPAGQKTGLYWKDGAPARAFAPGSRLLWFGRDPSWENVLGFRGKDDVEKGVGEWNTLVVTMRGDTMTVRLNGVTVSRATGLGVTRGRLQIQSEGSEVLFRRITLTPLDLHPEPRPCTGRDPESPPGVEGAAAVRF